MTFWTDILRQWPSSAREDWIAEKRDEAERLFRKQRREWINQGAEPKPRYWRA